MATTRQKWSFFLETLATPIGRELVVTDREGRVRALGWEDQELRLFGLLDRHYGKGQLAFVAPPAATGAFTALAAYFAGDVTAVDALETATRGTPFQREVWAAIRTVAPGRTASYGQLAARVGRPLAARAVGACNWCNPISIVVPCHRVVGAGGALTGFAGGLERKRWLLDHERAWLEAREPEATRSAPHP